MPSAAVRHDVRDIAPADRAVADRALADQAATDRAVAGGSSLPTAAAVPLRGRTTLARIAHEEFFDYQPTSTADLPDPRPLVENLTRCVIEILAGARELEQVARWVTDDVYRTLLTRASISARARAARGAPVVRPTFSVGEPRLSEPRDGIIEAVTIVTSRARARAVAIRLEGLDRRWRASAIGVL